MRPHKCLLWTGLSLICATVLAGCNVPINPSAGSEGGADNTKTEETIVIPVEAQRPIRRDISHYLVTYSRIEAEKRVEVTSEGMGRCVEVLVDEGDTVEKGQVLGELDKRDALAQLQQIEIQVRQTRSDYERAKQLFESGFIAPAEFENARFAHENALATERIRRLQLENLTITAPIHGVITRRNIQPGMLVSSGMPAFEVVDPDSFILNIDVDERELSRLRVGQVARAAVDALDSEEFEATVTRINPSVDPTTGTVKVRLEMAPEVRAKLREAAFARVRLVLETHENALLVPKDAIIEENIRQYVFVVEQQPTEASPAESGTGSAAREEPRHVARRVEVEVGLEDSDFAEILSGIDEDALVVTLGQKSLKPDAEIKVTTIDGELNTFETITAEEALDAATAKHEEQEQLAEEAKRAARLRRVSRQVLR